MAMNRTKRKNTLPYQTDESEGQSLSRLPSEDDHCGKEDQLRLIEAHRDSGFIMQGPGTTSGPGASKRASVLAAPFTLVQELQQNRDELNLEFFLRQLR